MDNNILYSVYSITEDVLEDIHDDESFADAYVAWEAAVAAEKARRLSEGAEYLETTVYLYDVWSGEMRAEETILEVGDAVALWRGSLWQTAWDLVKHMIRLGELSPGARGMSLEDVARQYNEANALEPGDGDYLHVLV